MINISLFMLVILTLLYSDFLVCQVVFWKNMEQYNEKNGVLAQICEKAQFFGENSNGCHVLSSFSSQIAHTVLLHNIM